MKRTILIILCCAAAALAADRKGTSTPDSQAAFEQLKSLAGEWDIRSKTEDHGGHATYTVLADGSAVQERYVPEGHPENEMLTVYYLDNGQLALNHYCMAHNQPHMTVRRFDAGSGDLAFDFAGGSNIAPGAGHMHNASFQFHDHDHFSSTWQFVEKGKVKFEEAFDYTRVR